MSKDFLNHTHLAGPSSSNTFKAILGNVKVLKDKWPKKTYLNILKSTNHMLKHCLIKVYAFFVINSLRVSRCLNSRRKHKLY
ncbi:hypothetical protein NUSPORA_01881 [Nucleospora cyclopteri]